MNTIVTETSKHDWVPITRIVDDLRKEGLPTFNRMKFYRLVKRKVIRIPRRPQGGGWRKISKEQAYVLKTQIKLLYDIE